MYASDSMTHDEKNLRRKIKILEEKLAVAVQERDDLTRDLENLCLSEGFNTSFSSSSVLSERIYSTGARNMRKDGSISLDDRIINMPPHVICRKRTHALQSGTTANSC